MSSVAFTIELLIIFRRYGVTGFPTIKFFPKGSTEPVDVSLYFSSSIFLSLFTLPSSQYTGGRGADDFISYLNEKCGTQRMKGGSLSPSVR